MGRGFKSLQMRQRCSAALTAMYLGRVFGSVTPRTRQSISVDLLNYTTKITTCSTRLIRVCTSLIASHRQRLNPNEFTTITGVVKPKIVPSGENGCGTGAERPLLVWLGVRVADGASLENWKSETVRGFESHPSRQKGDSYEFRAILFHSACCGNCFVLRRDCCCVCASGSVRQGRILSAEKI